MTVRDMFITFDDGTRFEVYKKDYDGELVPCFDGVLNYAEPWMLDLYVVKAFVGAHGEVNCICE